MTKKTLLAFMLATLCSLSATPFVAADIFLSFAGLGDGGAISNNATNLNLGDSAMAYIWMTDDTEIDTGAFLDLTNSNTSVLQFTAAEVFNPDIVSGGSVVNSRWESFSGGTVSAGLVDELNGFRIFGGTGILPSQVSGNANEDSFHDSGSSAFLFAAASFDVVGAGLAELSLSTGDGLIVHDGAAVIPNFRSASVSVSAVPEPTGIAMLAVVGAMLLTKRRRNVVT